MVSTLRLIMVITLQTVPKAVSACDLVMSTQLQSDQQVSLLNGQYVTMADLRDQLIETEQIRVDLCAGAQAYYWRCDVIHPYLRLGTLVLQRRKIKSGGFQYHRHFSQHQKAKAITVLQIAKRRCPIEVFFRESKQHLGMGHLPFRKWSSLRGHIISRTVLYFLLYCAWPETALLAKCKDRACQGTVAEKKRNFNRR